MLEQLATQDPNKRLCLDAGSRVADHTFLRLTSPTVIAKLRETFPDLPDQPDPRTVFLKLRELRNKW